MWPALLLFNVVIDPVMKKMHVGQKGVQLDPNWCVANHIFAWDHVIFANDDNIEAIYAILSCRDLKIVVDFRCSYIFIRHKTRRYMTIDPMFLSSEILNWIWSNLSVHIWSFYACLIKMLSFVFSQMEERFHKSHYWFKIIHTYLRITDLVTIS